MKETITIGQKLGFAVVIAFVLALCTTPFVGQSNTQGSQHSSIDDGVKNAQRVVAIR